jgi:hypothetical protein
MHMLVQFGLRNGAGFNSGLVLGAVEEAPGSSLSRPAAEAFSVECVPPQSESTKPGNCQSFLSTSVSRYLFSQAKSPLTRCRSTSRPRDADADADLEGQQVALARGTLAMM